MNLMVGILAGFASAADNIYNWGTRLMGRYRNKGRHRIQGTTWFGSFNWNGYVNGTSRA